MTVYCAPLHDHPLSRWLAEHRVQQAAFAQGVGVSKGYLTQLLTRTRTPSLDLAVRIETATDGIVPARSWICQDQGVCK